MDWPPTRVSAFSPRRYYLEAHEALVADAAGTVDVADDDVLLVSHGGHRHDSPALEEALPLGRVARELSRRVDGGRQRLERGGADETGGRLDGNLLVRLHSLRHLLLVHPLHVLGHVGEERLPEEEQGHEALVRVRLEAVHPRQTLRKRHPRPRAPRERLQSPGVGDGPAGGGHEGLGVGFEGGHGRLGARRDSLRDGGDPSRGGFLLLRNLLLGSLGHGPAAALLRPGAGLLPPPPLALRRGEFGLVEVHLVDGGERGHVDLRGGAAAVGRRGCPELRELEGLEVGVAVDEAARGEMRELDARVLTHEGARAGDRGDDDDAAVLGVAKGEGRAAGSPREKRAGGLVEARQGEGVSLVVVGLEKAPEGVRAIAGVVDVPVALGDEGVHDALGDERVREERDGDPLLGEELHAARALGGHSSAGVLDDHGLRGHEIGEESRLGLVGGLVLVLGADGEHEERVLEEAVGLDLLRFFQISGHVDDGRWCGARGQMRMRNACAFKCAVECAGLRLGIRVAVCRYVRGLCRRASVCKKK
ncbi:predicted protein [Micromonas commoda]|uniref:Uncharacterized protein n=1 Tax=Micromonas commoda (strain RCC299 / NOUM17 / CCMP2709) TaxID=296587 RepID=C1E2G1_MICCC|nr:predicted protein [Micromonas commoda]ACO62336.1 predicted protein [Micromonas commoda]|eukprot:XP_002501078.1 predicted protein [Micromonas commoda]